jgi:peptidyl-prolyl cis-trans isomerase C
MIRKAHAFGLFIAVLGGTAAAAHAQDKVKVAAPAPYGDKAAKAPKGDKGAKIAAANAPPPAGDKPTVHGPADLERRAQVLVTYKGGEVTIGELEDAISQQSPFMRERYKDPKNLEELLDKTLRFELLAQAAAERGVDKNSEVRQAVKQNAVQQMMKVDFDDKMSAADVPQDEIAKYYQDHIDEYVQPAMQRASHVVVATEAEAKALLEQVKTMDLRAFRQLARDKSTDETTKLRGGDLRYFDKDGKVRGDNAASVPAPIVKAAFGLKEVGDTATAPIKVDGGFSIVKLTGQRPAISRKLPEVEETIRVRLWREQRQKAIEGFVAGLRERVKPDVKAEMIEQVKLADPPSQSRVPQTPTPRVTADEGEGPEAQKNPHAH